MSATVNSLGWRPQPEEADDAVLDDGELPVSPQGEAGAIRDQGLVADQPLEACPVVGAVRAENSMTP